MMNNKSVANFIKELNIRLDLFNNSMIINNLDSSKADNVNEILNKYIHKSPEEMNVQDICAMKYDDINDILSLIGLSKEERNYLLLDFNPAIYSIKTNKDDSRICELNKYFDNLRKIIDNYINEFKVISESQKDLKKEKIELYHKYIDLLSCDSFNKPFSDFEELNKLMSSIALSSEDRWNILKYIDECNIKTNKFGVNNINVINHIAYNNGQYLNNKELVDLVKNETKDMDVDIDLIPSISKSIAQRSGYKSRDVVNVLGSLVCNTLYDEYLKDVKDNDEEKINNVISMIKETLKYIDDKYATTVEKAKEIVINSNDIYKDEIKKGNDVMKYMDISIQDIELDNISHEKAVALKSLPVVKTISETLDKMSLLDKSSKAYNSYCKLLNNLEDAYQDIYAE